MTVPADAALRESSLFLQVSYYPLLSIFLGSFAPLHVPVLTALTETALSHRFQPFPVTLCETVLNALKGTAFHPDLDILCVPPRPLRKNNTAFYGTAFMDSGSSPGMTALEGRGSKLDFMASVWYWILSMDIQEYNSAFNFYWWWHNNSAGEGPCR
jgi:hypothetical protein